MAVWIEPHVGKALDVDVNEIFFHPTKEEPQK